MPIITIVTGIVFIAVIIVVVLLVRRFMAKK
jgi:hypothetical protein